MWKKVAIDQYAPFFKTKCTKYFEVHQVSTNAPVKLQRSYNFVSRS